MNFQPPDNDDPRDDEPGVIELAKRFHDYYEAMAPRYGYETRKDTREFDQYTPNGRLMIAVVRRLRASLAAPVPQSAESGLEPVISLMWDKSADGSYFARMLVSGLKSEQQAQGAVDHMQAMFCGQQQEPQQ